MRLIDDEHADAGIGSSEQAAPLGDLPPQRHASEAARFVDAPDEESVIKRAIEEFGITNPQVQKRLLAQRRT
jgi:hypothetical protein